MKNLTLLLFVFLLGLSGCGQTGPLMLPDDSADNAKSEDKPSKKTIP